MMKRKTALAFAAVFFALPAFAQVENAPAMVDGLVPQAMAPAIGKTRSLGAPRQRAIMVKGREETVVAAIDLQVPFDFDSDQISEAAKPILAQLGAALKDEKLAGFRFVVAGHTDAKGEEAYNASLSERRAQAVLKHLTTEFGIEAARLDSKGLGESELKDRNDPEGGINRRVEVLNVGKTS
jgi:outer membrane protein OmpA-like peptidoglycan-associated protein